MNVLDLFAGIGGLSLGLERAGMTVVGQVEIDPFCRRLLAKHWPEVPRHDDVRTAVQWWGSERRPRVDVVAGGFPCQPVSLAGRGLAQEDERWLWPEFSRIIRELRPGFAIMENVPGLLGRGAGIVLGDLAEIGYDAEWDCVSAADVGAPHRRDRFFCVAYPQSHRRRQGRPRRPAGQGAHREGLAPQELADTVRTGLERPVESGPQPAELGTPLADPDRGRRGRRPRIFRQTRRRQPAHHGWWATEPDVGRVADGVPGRRDRLKSLGNAVVPQVAEHIGRLVMAGAA